MRTLGLVAALLLASAPAASAQTGPASGNPAAAGPAADDPLDYNASVAEYNGATAGETFARTVAEICPRILDGRIDLDGEASALARVSLRAIEGEPPSFLRTYPRTRWFAVADAPNNVFLSIDADPRARRCRVAFANNLLVGAAHLWTDGLLTRDGARLVMRENDTRRNLHRSVHMLPRGEEAIFSLVQTVPQPERGGRGWQGDASVSKLSREQAQAFGLSF